MSLVNVAIPHSRGGNDPRKSTRGAAFKRAPPLTIEERTYGAPFGHIIGLVIFTLASLPRAKLALTRRFFALAHSDTRVFSKDVPRFDHGIMPNDRTALYDRAASNMRAARDDGSVELRILLD